MKFQLAIMMALFVALAAFTSGASAVCGGKSGDDCVRCCRKNGLFAANRDNCFCMSLPPVSKSKDRMGGVNSF